MINLPKLIGHRGVMGLSPENTLNSIELANKLGLKWIEIDVKISKDMIPILMHDDTLDRTTSGKGLPINFTYNELKKLDAGSFFYHQQTNIYIPSLEEVLLFCIKNNMGINIELKPNIKFERKNVEAIAKLLVNFKYYNQYYFSSFDWNSIIFMKQLLPNSYCGLLVDEFSENNSLNNALNICYKYNLSFCGLNKNIINSKIISEIKERNMVITVFSNENLEPKEANELWLKGVDSVFIDDPTKFSIF